MKKHTDRLKVMFGASQVGTLAMSDKGNWEVKFKINENPSPRLK